MVARRTLLAGIAGAAALAVGPRVAWAQALSYTITPVAVAEGVWVVRGVDAAIERSNGGAIANIGIIATPAGTVLVDCGTSLRYGTALKGVAEQLTGKPVIRVYLTHLHPDHIYGAVAFDPAIVAATPQLAAVLARDGAGFADGMYRLLGDWMRGTEFAPPGKLLREPEEIFGGRRLRLLALSGHSEADLAILDETSGTLFTGDLVFHDRAPSTPHANLAHWRASLDTLRGLGQRRVVPGHGPVDPTPTAAIDQTRDWIDWVESSLRDAAASGLDMVEAGNIAIPPRFASVKAARYELQRTASHLYPGFETTIFPRIDPRR